MTSLFKKNSMHFIDALLLFCDHTSYHLFSDYLNCLVPTSIYRVFSEKDLCRVGKKIGGKMPVLVRRKRGTFVLQRLPVTSELMSRVAINTSTYADRVEQKAVHPFG
jgi:hypothetical protein